MENLKSKVCNICNLRKDIGLFYVNKAMKDGYQNRCIECTKLKSKIRYEKIVSTPEGVISERERHRKKYYRLDYRKKYSHSTEKKRETIKKYNQKFPEKALARKYTEIFLTKVEEFHLHHWSYNQEDWLDVIQLSIKEHHFLHRYIIYDQERMMYRGLDGVLLDTKEKHLKYYDDCKLKYDP